MNTNNGSSSEAGRTSTSRGTNSRGGRGGGRGGRGSRGGRGRGGRGGGGSSSGRGGSSSSGNNRGSSTSSLITDTGGKRDYANLEMSGARPEEMANAAAEQFECNVGKRMIPRGGLCVHRPVVMACDSNTNNNRNAAAVVGGATSASAAAAPNVHDDYLTFTRNLFLQTPQPRGEMTIDQIWDDAAEHKFGGVTLPLSSSSSSTATAGKKRGRKRKAQQQEGEQDGDDGISSSSPIPPLPMKTEQETIIGSDGLVDAKPSAAAAAETVLNQSQQQQQKNSSSTMLLPMCGLEDDERMLSFLQANHGGDLEKAKFSIMVNSDRGHGRCPIVNSAEYKFCLLFV